MRETLLAYEMAVGLRSLVRPAGAPILAALIAGHAAAAGPQVIDLEVRDGKVAIAQSTLAVKQHSELELRWTSDRPIELHLHGYGIAARATPQAPATMRFKARLAGRFPVSEHRSDGQHHRAVVYLEVHP
jgi:hypothetical protein